MPSWSATQIGAGGAFTALAQAADGRLFALGDVGGISRSIDNGANWVPLGSAQGINDQNLYAVVCLRNVGPDPGDEEHLLTIDYVFVGGDGGINGRPILVSTDNGNTFSELFAPTGFCSAMTAADVTLFAAIAADYNVMGPKIYRCVAPAVNGLGFVECGVMPDFTYVRKLLYWPYSQVPYLFALSSDAPALNVTVGGGVIRGLYRSSDGAGWTRVGPLGAGGVNLDIYDVRMETSVMVPGTPPRLWIATSGGVYLSNDAGATWVGPQAAPASTTALAIVPRARQELATLRPVAGDPLGDQSSNSYVTVDSDEYALSGEWGNYAGGGDQLGITFYARVRVNGGTPVGGQFTWSVGSNPGMTAPIIDTSIPTGVWTTVRTALVTEVSPTTHNYGPWTPANLTLLRFVGVKITAPGATIDVADAWGIIDGNPTIVVAENTGNKFAASWITENGGASWTSYLRTAWDSGWKERIDGIGCFGGNLYGVCTALVETGSAIWWLTNNFLYRSLDGGRSFHNVFTKLISPHVFLGNGLDNAICTALAASGNVLYAAYYDLGLAVFRNGGWKSISKSPPGWTDGKGGNSLTILADPALPQKAWAALSNNASDPAQLLRTTDYGDTQTVITAGLPSGFMMGLTLDPDSPAGNRTLYITVAGILYRSTDDGVNWTAFPSIDGKSRVVAAKGLHVFVGGEGGLWRSVDGGANFIQCDPSIFPVGTTADVQMEWKGVHCIHIPAGSTGVVYATYYKAGASAATQGGLYKSTDWGVSWARVLQDKYSRNVATDPADTTIVVHTSSSAAKGGGNAGSGSTGVSKSIDSAGTFAGLNDGLPFSEFAWPLAIAPDGAIWISQCGTGIWKFA